MLRLTQLAAAASVLALVGSLAACGDQAREPSRGGPGAGGSAGDAGNTGGAGDGAAGSPTAGAAGMVPTAEAAGAPSAIPASFDTVKLVFGGGGGIMPCSAAPCHGVGGNAPPGRPLELPPNDDARLYMNLTSFVSTACGGKRLVAPFDPAQSALVAILSGPCGMTPRMPYGCDPEVGDCIPDEYVAAVAQWIADGAPMR